MKKPARNKIPVVFIAGVGKSGSTLLSKVLGQAPGFTDVGELINLSTQASRDGKCACGAVFSECPFWEQVIRESIGDIQKLDKKKWNRLRARYAPLLLLPGVRRRLSDYFSDLAKIYKAVVQVSGNGVVVDSSKSVFHGFLLEFLPEVELYFVHLVRDARASEGSMYRLRKAGLPKMRRRGPWTNAMRWMALNFLAERLGGRIGERYMFVRYEDFISDPRGVLTDLLTRVQGSSGELSFLCDDTVHLTTSHTLSGSGVRFKTGPLVLKYDERWREALPGYNLWVVEHSTKWFRRRYGY